jgi:hypothetical protein
MFDWVLEGIEGIKQIFYDLVDWFVEKGSDALDSIGIADEWEDILQTEIIEDLLAYAPLADKLIYWDVITLITVAEMTILIGILSFKIVVKLIPTIW